MLTGYDFLRHTHTHTPANTSCITTRKKLKIKTTYGGEVSKNRWIVHISESNLSMLWQKNC